MGILHILHFSHLLVLNCAVSTVLDLIHYTSSCLWRHDFADPVLTRNVGGRIRALGCWKGATACIHRGANNRLPLLVPALLGASPVQGATLWHTDIFSIRNLLEAIAQVLQDLLLLGCRQVAALVDMIFHSH